MTKEPTNVEKIRGLPWGIGADAANTVFAQFTFFGSTFILFLSQLNFNNTQIGFLFSLIPFSGLVALFVAPAVARYGYKRTFVTFWGLRKIVTIFLLLTPWVVAKFGGAVALVFVTVIVIAFSLFRAIGETGKYPWTQEYIPNAVRGKFTAANNLFSTLAGLLAVTVAGYAIDNSSGLTGYMILIGAGVVFGLVAVWAYSFIPGGAPLLSGQVGSASTSGLLETMKDRGFVRYLVGVSLLTLATVPMVSFLPLFMQEQVGLASGMVVLLQNGTLVGGLISGYLWGWAADRYGSKPIMISGIFIRVFLPIAWILMPRHSGLSLSFAVGISILQGVADLGWAIGSARLLFVQVVPPDQKGDYMAVYYAWIGVVGGLSQLAGGVILDLSHSISGSFYNITLDPYLPLFVLGLVLTIASFFIFRKVRADSTVGVGEFATLFLRGNPFQAMGSMIRYHRAKDEHATVMMTELMSRSGSLLTVDELLEALVDPRFNVRFEAIVSIARMRPDPRLTAALVELLNGTELALSVVSAWALGRIGDRQALGPLQQALESDFRSIQLHSARALGAMGHDEIAPVLLDRLVNESNKGLQMAFASALGQLRAVESADVIMAFLYDTENEGARIELALALARIAGDEHSFIQLLKQTRLEVGTAASQAVSGLQRKWSRQKSVGPEIGELCQQCAKALALGDLNLGAKLLARIAESIAADIAAPPIPNLLNECARRLDEYGAARIEYLLLALHTLMQI